jgi:hypothetical protein
MFTVAVKFLLIYINYISVMNTFLDTRNGSFRFVLLCFNEHLLFDFQGHV